MTPTHHPSDELLFDYASGSQAEPVALLVATHLALCPGCRDAVARLELLGGDMVDGLDPTPLADSCLESLLERLDAAPPPPAASPPPDLVVPRPLRDYLSCGSRDLPWNSKGRHIDEIDLLGAAVGYRTRLLRIRAGRSVPMHTHEGTELTLLLAGGFSDTTGHFRRGDVAVADRTIEHQPLADAGEDCICLAVCDGPLRLTGPVGRLFNRFVDI